jgi:hypothetical protein
MKTNIELSDVLLHAAKALAKQNRTTLRALAGEDLRRVLSEPRATVAPKFKLCDASVRGGDVLITDPRHWRQMEVDQEAARLAPPLP